MAQKTPFSTTKNAVNYLKGLFSFSPSSAQYTENFGSRMKRSVTKDFLIFMALIGLAFFIALSLFFSLVSIIFIINTSSMVTPISLNIASGGGVFDPGGGFADPSSCPLSGGRVSLGSYNPSMETDRGGGHGSSYYWNQVYSGRCYSIPQGMGCMASEPPDSNRCNSADSTNTCPYYGFAADVSSSDPRVILPLVNGESRDWVCDYAFANGSVGDTIRCNTTSGSPAVVLTLTHVIAEEGFHAEGPSGTIVTQLFDQPGNTHLHLEVRIDGSPVRPENYFCGS